MVMSLSSRRNPAQTGRVPYSYSVVLKVTGTTLYEYGTLPVWAGFLRDDKLITMHYLVWPNRAYPWDHISTFQETWTRLP